MALWDSCERCLHGSTEMKCPLKHGSRDSDMFPSSLAVLCSVGHSSLTADGRADLDLSGASVQLAWHYHQCLVSHPHTFSLHLLFSLVSSVYESSPQVLLCKPQSRRARLTSFVTFSQSSSILFPLASFVSFEVTLCHQHQLPGG